MCWSKNFNPDAFNIIRIFYSVYPIEYSCEITVILQFSCLDGTTLSGRKWFRQGFPVLSEETERLLHCYKPWKVYHAKGRSNTEVYSQFDLSSTFYMASLHGCLCMSPTMAAVAALVGCTVDWMISQSKLKQPMQSLFTSFLALVQLSYYQIYTKLII